MKITHFPADQGTNPYQSILIAALRDAGLEVDAVIDGELPFLRLVLRGDADILHLHWMHSKIISRRLPIAVIRFVIMHLCLAIWCLRGKKIVWTIHQLNNHERHRLWLDRLNSRLLARWATRCIVHGKSAIPLVVEALGVPKEKLSVILHPSYAMNATKIPHPPDSQARRKLLYFGLIRPYKNVPNLINTLRGLNLPVDLRVCGMPYTEELRNEIQSAAQDMESVRLDLRFIPEEELHQALTDCDIVALPFSDIFTSGSLIMAMSAARPVIAPRAGLVEDYVDEDCAYLYDIRAEDGLATALKNAAYDTQVPQKGMAAFERSKQLSAPNLVNDLIRLYRDSLGAPDGGGTNYGRI